MTIPRKAIKRKKPVYSRKLKKKPVSITKMPISKKLKKPRVIVIFTGGYAEGERMQKAFNKFLAKKGLTGKFEVKTRSLLELDHSSVTPSTRYIAKVRALRGSDAILIDPILLKKLKRIFPDAVKFLSRKRIFKIEEFTYSDWEMHFTNMLSKLLKK